MTPASVPPPLALATPPGKPRTDNLAALEMGGRVEYWSSRDVGDFARIKMLDGNPGTYWAFAGITTFDQNVVSYLELLRLRYTGCNPRGLILARDKALSKKLLAYHRIPVPDFSVVRYGRKPVLPKKMGFPLIVKSLFFEASAGISQASVVENGEQLARRVQFIHESLGTAAIVEQFIDG